MHFAESYFSHITHTQEASRKRFWQWAPQSLSLSQVKKLYVCILLNASHRDPYHHTQCLPSCYVWIFILCCAALSLWVQSAVLYFFWPTTKTFPRISYQVILKRKQFDYIYCTTGYVWIGNIFQLIYKAVTPKYKLITFILFSQWIPSKS